MTHELPEIELIHVPVGIWTSKYWQYHTELGEISFLEIGHIPMKEIF